ncbi:hypothetical protein GCM10007108_16740 [Thermogymnomonas acidicola]|uniref:Uncharacterized protein n=1 Tax=Thermogymnomonas acidicola TaxID=399579 RepID=A0AA37BSM7_9ARCH|nr:hypothetical protein [Thermogymnomonas acidicola]GGM79173.1 hypothetical protein GCM10007108_16740 [Thermogymnomonas acidicola]
MSLLILDTLRYFDGEINENKVSRLCVTVAKKLLGQAYNIPNYAMVSGRIQEISVSPDTERVTEALVAGRERLNGSKFEGFFLSSGSGQRDYLLFTPKLASTLREYAIFPEEYEMKIEVEVVSFKMKKLKVYTKGTVIDNAVMRGGEPV